MAGTTTQYVPRKVSEDVLGRLKTFFTDDNFRRSALFVFGAVGSGKSRLGLRTAQAYKERAHSKALVGYHYLDMGDVSILGGDIEDYEMTSDRKMADSATAQRFLAQHIIESNRNNAGTATTSNPNLAAILREWAAALRSRAPKPGLPVHIICHLDEVQGKPWASACVVRAIRDVKRKLDLAGVHVIPLLTGLSTARTQAVTEAVSETNSESFYLTYFHPVQEREQIRTLVVNAMNAVIKNLPGKGEPLPSLPFDTIDNLQRLVDDCFGWTMGLVRLGAACADERGLSGREPALWDFRRVEKDAFDFVKEVYKRIAGSVAAALSVEPSALTKLLLFAMTPIEVGCSLMMMSWKRRARKEAVEEETKAVFIVQPANMILRVVSNANR